MSNPGQFDEAGLKKDRFLTFPLGRAELAQKLFSVACASVINKFNTIIFNIFSWL